MEPTKINGTNRAVAAHYVRLLWQPAPVGNLLLWTLPDEKSRWFDGDDVDGLAQSTANLATTADGVYLGCGLSPKSFGVNKRCKAADIIGIPGLWADIDIKGEAHKTDKLPPDLDSAIALANEMPLPPSIMVHSGHGVYPWWLLTSPWMFTDTNEHNCAAKLVKGWQTHINILAARHQWKIDGTGDLARVLRIPGSVNRKIKDAPVLVTCDAPADIRRYQIDEFGSALKAAAPTPTQKPRSTYVYNDDTATEIRKALAALAALSPSRTETYEEWVAVGMALHSVSDSLLGSWISWSSQSTKFKPGECEQKWRGFVETDGITIGSLIAWAKADSPGWCPAPTPKIKWTSPAIQPSTAGTPNEAPAPQTIADIILVYLKRKFDPTFKRSDRIWSNALSREVLRAEACTAPTSDFVSLMMTAIDYPRDKDGPLRNKAPNQFRQWSPFAWADLLASLPDEPESSEIAHGASEQFWNAVAGALMTIEAMAPRDRLSEDAKKDTLGELTAEVVRTVQGAAEEGPQVP